MDEYIINVTQSAYEDLAGIASYIKDTLMEPVVAINQVSRIKTGIYSLNTFPKRYPLVRDKMLAAKGYRCMFIDNYTVFYIVSETSKSVSSNTVEISRIQYSRRNWIDLL